MNPNGLVPLLKDDATGVGVVGIKYDYSLPCRPVWR
ncbi:Uncharacterised protein [Klebsiella quasipneumoniae]|nr:Uncharacterised protein [Klebsiella quasipneumoniae]